LPRRRLPAHREIRIGLISDTHGLLRPQALDAMAGCDAIVHAGDIGAPEVLEALRALAPLTIVRGNNDMVAWARGIPDVADLVIGGARIRVIHDVHDIDVASLAGRVDVLVCGHSHQPRIAREHGVLVVNPGSAGPRRFSLPISVGYLTIDGDSVRAELETLEVATPPARTPGRTRAARPGSGPRPSRSPRR
jgi:putative phosphoesterase